jgi:hypothetical protein
LTFPKDSSVSNEFGENIDSVGYTKPSVIEYTHEELAQLKLMDLHGNYVYWSEIYFAFTYPRNGLFPRRIFDQVEQTY